MSVRIQVSEEALRDVQQKLGQFSDKAPNAISNALNRAVTNIQSNIPKEVRQTHHVKVGDVKSTLKSSKASRSSLSGEVRSSGKVLGLDHFKISPKTVNPKRKSQLKIAVKKNGIKTVLGSFIANLNGNKVFKREGKSRLPIGRLFGPSVPQMIDEQGTVNAINEKALVTYNTRLNHEINRLLERLGAS